MRGGERLFCLFVFCFLRGEMGVGFFSSMIGDTRRARRVGGWGGGVLAVLQYVPSFLNTLKGYKQQQLPLPLPSTTTITVTTTTAATTKQHQQSEEMTGRDGGGRKREGVGVDQPVSFQPHGLD